MSFLIDFFPVSDQSSVQDGGTGWQTDVFPSAVNHEHLISGNAP